MSHVIFKWLHLSDIHFSEKAGFNTSLIQSSLPEYLEALKEEYNCIVLSGDFRYAPDEIMEIEGIAQYVNTLLFATKLSKDKIVMTPGNHDLLRTDTIEDDILNAVKGYNPSTGIIKASYLKRLLDNFNFYSNLQSKITQDTDMIVLKNNPHSIVDMGSCYFLVLNTALTAYGGGEKDKGKLIIGVKYLFDLINNTRNKPKPIIAIGHHGLDWFDERERNEILPWFNQEGIKLYLCGHSHEFSSRRFDSLVQITVGCMQDNNQLNVDAAFSIGQLYSNGKVIMIFYEWSNKYKQWIKEYTPIEYCVFDELYSFPSNYEIEQEKRRIEKTDHPFTISKVISNSKGVKYIWEKDGCFVESITINSKGKGVEKKTSLYTISTSAGCSSQNTCNCKFCETGRNGEIMPLSAEDIALQCIFMALYDIDYCSDHPEVQDNKREFAFQSQGASDYHLEAVKKAILLNDLAMSIINQKEKISRYVISTRCEIKTISFSDIDAQDAGDSTIRAFNAAVRLLDDAKKEYKKSVQ